MTQARALEFSKYLRARGDESLESVIGEFLEHSV